MFGFKLVNNDGKISVDDTNPVYAFLDVNGAVSFEDPRGHFFNYGNFIGEDGSPLGNSVNLFLRFATPLDTLHPPLLFGRDKAGTTSRTVISGVAAVGTPGNWLGMRLAFTTTHPDANSMDPVAAYMAARASCCDFAIAIPGGSFYPGTSIRVADANGRLVFDALNHHPSYQRPIGIRLIQQVTYSQSMVSTVSTYAGDYTLQGNEWVYLGSGVGLVSRSGAGILGSGFMVLGQGRLFWVGTRFSSNVSAGDIWTNVAPWVARTRRVVTSPIQLPNL